MGRVLATIGFGLAESVHSLLSRQRQVRIRVALYLLFLSVFVPGLGTAGIVSEEIRLDPGYRYVTFSNPTFPVVGVREDTLGFFISDVLRDEMRLYKRGLLGEEVGLGFTSTRSGFVYDVLWEEDGGLWVLESKGVGQLQLTHRPSAGAEDVDREVVLQDDAEGLEYLWLFENYPILRAIDDELWVAWSDSRIEVRRLSSDLELLDSLSYEIGGGGSFGFEPSSDGHLLVWPGLNELFYIEFDPQGQPKTVAAQRVNLQSRALRAAVARVEENWLLAYSDVRGEVRLGVFDSGQLSSSERHQSFADCGLSLVAGDNEALLVIRDYNPTALRVDWEGNRLGEAIELRAGEWQWDPVRPQQVDALWTGSQYVVVLPEYVCCTTAAGCRYDPPWRVSAFWIDPTIDTKAERFEINETFAPTAAWSHFSDGNFVQVMHDPSSDGFQFVSIPSEGAPHPIKEYRIEDPRCDRRMLSVSGGSAGETVLLAYKTESQSFDFSWERLIVERTDPLGESRSVFGVAGKQLFVQSVSADGDDDAAWVAYIGETLDLRSATVGYNGSLTSKSWPFGDESTTKAKIAGTRDAGLVVWESTEEFDGRGLRFATIDPLTQDGPIVGAWLWPDVLDRVRLLEVENGPASDLVVFTEVDSSGETSLYTVAIRDGDPGPPIRHDGVGEDTHADVVWDGYRFFVAWTTPMGGVEAVRVGANGLSVDAEPKKLFAHHGPISLSSDGAGTIGMAYGGNRFRKVVDDPSPILVSGLEATWLAEGVEIAWIVHEPEPALYEVLRVVGTDDSELASVGTVPATLGRMAVIDYAAETGTNPRYLLRATYSSGRAGTIGSVTATSSSTVSSVLTLQVRPNPVRDGRAFFEFRLPDSAEPGAVRSTGDTQLELSIFDTTGRRVHSERGPAVPSGMMEWDYSATVPTVSAGVYFATMRWGKLSVTRPMTVLSR